MEMTYETFVKQKCSDKDGSLLTLSKFKRENPSLYAEYDAKFQRAYNDLVSQSNRHIAKRDKGMLITPKTIMQNTR